MIVLVYNMYFLEIGLPHYGYVLQGFVWKTSFLVRGQSHLPEIVYTICRNSRNFYCFSRGFTGILLIFYKSRTPFQKLIHRSFKITYSKISLAIYEKS